MKVQTPAEMLEKVAAQVKRHAPDVEFVPVYRMWKTPMTSRFAEPIRQAIITAQQLEPLLIPTMGGSLQDYVSLGVPAFVGLYADADQANHAPNENLKLDSASSGGASSRPRGRSTKLA